MERPMLAEQTWYSSCIDKTEGGIVVVVVVGGGGVAVTNRVELSCKKEEE